MSENNGRYIKPSLVAKVLLSTASLLEVTGWIDGVARDIHGQPTLEMDLPRALNQVVYGSYGGREGLWKTTREMLLDEINKDKNRFASLADWNDRQVNEDAVLTLLTHTAEKLCVQRQATKIEMV